MKINISIYYWGGEPIRTLSSGDEILPDDREILKEWSKILSDPGKFSDVWISWVTTGRVWLEGPSEDRQRRLLLRPFYKQTSGVRGQWSFCGYVFPTNIGEPAVWTTVLRRLLEISEQDLADCDGNLTIENVNSWQSGDHYQVPIGQVFHGTYSSALDQLCNSLAACDWKDLEDLRIACHPPSTIPAVTSLVLSDDFPLQNIGLLPGKPAGTERTETLRVTAPVVVTSKTLLPPASLKPEQNVFVRFSKKLIRPTLMLLAVLITYQYGKRTGNDAANEAVSTLRKENTNLLNRETQMRSEMAEIKKIQIALSNDNIRLKKLIEDSRKRIPPDIHTPSW